MAKVKVLPGHMAQVQTYVMISLAQGRSEALLKLVDA